jgi:hypothetical protein
MSISIRVASAAFVALTAATFACPTHVFAAASSQPSSQTTVTTTERGFIGSMEGTPATRSGQSVAQPAAVTRVNDCGTPPAIGHVIRDFTDPCATATNECAGRPQTSPTGQPLTILSTQIQNPKGTWSQGPVDCGAAAGPPGLDQGAIHDAFVKLVPTPTIGTAPPATKTGLVYVEVLTWLATPATVNLGTTPLLGHQVTLTATVQSVVWTWGDDSTDTIHKPGRPFLSTDYCDTKQCPDWFGHTYTATGIKTITATTTWTGRYSIVGANSLPITGTATSTPATSQIHIQQSRTVLVPNPTTS